MYLNNLSSLSYIIEFADGQLVGNWQLDLNCMMDDLL